MYELLRQWGCLNKCRRTANWTVFLSVVLAIAIGIWGGDIPPVCRCFVFAFWGAIAGANVVGGPLWGCVLSATIGVLAWVHHLLQRRDAQSGHYTYRCKGDAFEHPFTWNGAWWRNPVNALKECTVYNYRVVAAGVSALLDSDQWESRNACLLILTLVFDIGRVLGAAAFSLCVSVPVSAALALVLLAAGLVVVVTRNVACALLRGWTCLYVKLCGFGVICTECGRAVEEPVYVCPKCKTRHADLTPSVKWGVFTHRCHCGQLLPASRFFGKLKLTAHCADTHCAATLPAYPSLQVPVVLEMLGADSCGKSTVLASLFRWISSCRSDVTIVPSCRDGDRDADPRQKTKAARVRIADAHLPVSWGMHRLMFFDPPGCEFSSGVSLASHLHSAYTQGVILVIDAAALRVSADTRPGGRGVLARDVKTQEDVISRWVLHMDTNHPGVMERCACAVVITHLDDTRASEVPLSRRSSSDDCRNFLERIDFTVPERKFRAVRYFPYADTPEANGELFSWLLGNIRGAGARALALRFIPRK